MAAFYYDVIMFYIELIYTFSAPFDHEEKKAMRNKRDWVSVAQHALLFSA